MDSSSPEILPYAMALSFPPKGLSHTSYDIIAAQFAARIGSNDNGYCTPSSMWSCPPSPTSSIDTNRVGDDTDEFSHSSTSASENSSASTTQKGRRSDRYKNCSDAVLSKRRAQNRANQRAYRKRKEQRLGELQQRIDEMNQKNDALCCAYRLLANECCRLRADQFAKQPRTTWDMNAAGSLALDMAALEMYRANPLPASSPITEACLDYPESPERLWGHYP
ncbi:hypothetical protein CSOJ01_14972 [Colletotrichum sojae]|uniref:BZIP domain-containing protein n=1 Tax=Colletotrichum sojae TaxID=2175907 RepID=A0A8H6MJH4_9PEZI|nr:hypothetical protein CSOJ01_14972 [Colletotrichum sojae]